MIPVPASSKWPELIPLVGGHKNHPWKGHFFKTPSSGHEPEEPDHLHCSSWFPHMAPWHSSWNPWVGWFTWSRITGPFLNDATNDFLSVQRGTWIFFHEDLVNCNLSEKLLLVTCCLVCLEKVVKGTIFSGTNRAPVRVTQARAYFVIWNWKSSPNEGFFTRQT